MRETIGRDLKDETFSFIDEQRLKKERPSSLVSFSKSKVLLVFIPGQLSCGTKQDIE
jgi:hypothetical protein